MKIQAVFALIALSSAMSSGNGIAQEDANRFTREAALQALAALPWSYHPQGHEEGEICPKRPACDTVLVDPRLFRLRSPGTHIVPSLHDSAGYLPLAGPMRADDGRTVLVPYRSRVVSDPLRIEIHPSAFVGVVRPGSCTTSCIVSFTIDSRGNGWVWATVEVDRQHGKWKTRLVQY